MKRQWILLVLAVAVTTVVSVLIPRLSRPLERFDVGLRLLEQGRAADAVHLFEDPQWRAVAEYRAGRYQRAVASFASSRESASLYNLGTAYARLNNWDGAKAAYREALRLDPDHTDAQHNLTIVLKAQELEQQLLAEQRDERKLGRFEDGNQTDEPREQDDGPPKEGKGSAEKGEQTATDQHSARGGQSDIQGTAGDQIMSTDAQSGATQGMPADDNERGVENGPVGAAAPIRRESVQAGEILLREIHDDPARVLKARLRAIHAQRQNEAVQ